MKITKLVDLVSTENCFFMNKCFSYKSYSVFSHLYNIATGRRNHQTRFAMNGLLILPLNLAQKLSYIPQLLLGILSKLCFQKKIPE